MQSTGMLARLSGSTVRLNRMPLVPRNAGCHLTHRRNAQDTHRQVFSNTVICEAAASSSTAFSGAVDMPKAATAIAIGILVKLVVPCPDGIAQQGWDLLCIFLSTIAGVVLKPLPMSAWSFLGATAAVVTGCATFPDTFRAFTNEAMWLVILSFFFARGVENTGLGDRIACHFVRALGSSPLGLAYGLVLAETALAPAMPSSAARAGAVFSPVISSVSRASGSLPGDASRNVLGRFLTMTQLQSSVASSALFLTACAQSFLCLKLAADMGIAVASPFFTWFLGACVPALVSLAVTPLIILRIMPPERKSTPEAPVEAKRRLEGMGPMAPKERLMASVMGATLVLWVAGDGVGISPTCAAMLGLSALMVTGCLTWSECLDNKSAWDTLMWFAILLGMAAQLTSVGVIPFLAAQVGGALTSVGSTWLTPFALLTAGYFVLHYLFASQTAHVGALYGAFLAMMLGTGVPGQLAALTLAYGSSLNAAITHYASGQGAVYVGTGYINSTEVFKVGALMGAVNMLIWGAIGMPWWKALGFF